MILSLPTRVPLYSRLLPRLLLGLLVGVVCLWFALRGLTLAGILQALRLVSPVWITVAIMGVVAVAMAKAARWQMLFRTGQELPAFGDLFMILMMAQMINLIIPIRLGELLRISLMKQINQPGTITFSTLVAEKTLDLLATGLVTASLIALAIGPGWLHERGSSLLLIGFVIVTGLGLSWWLRETIEQSLAHLLVLGNIMPPKWQRRLLDGIKIMFHVLGTLTERQTLVWIAFWTLNVWLLSLLTILALFTAFGWYLPVSAAVTLMLAVSVSNIAPSPPALVGVIPFIAVLVLDHYGVTQPLAAAFGLILNIVTVGPLIILGAWGFWSRTISLLAWLNRPPADKLGVE